MVKMKQHKALNQKISSFLPKTQKEPKTFSSLYFNFYVFQLKRKQSNKKKRENFLCAVIIEPKPNNKKMFYTIIFDPKLNQQNRKRKYSNFLFQNQFKREFFDSNRFRINKDMT